jgi:hypothetical protein
MSNFKIIPAASLPREQR